MMRLLAVFIVLYSASFCFGDTQTFTHGETTLEVEFVTVSSPGNLPDVNGAGGVDYVYAISKFELPPDTACAIGEEISPPAGGCEDIPNIPGLFTSPGSAGIFVNWINTSQGFSPAYNSPESDNGVLQEWSPTDPGYDPDNPIRNSGAMYVIPTTDEWYKAAYFDPAEQLYYDFATGSDQRPLDVDAGTDQATAVLTAGHSPAQYAPHDSAGGLSPFGTMGQTGNVPEWEESVIVSEFGTKYGSIRFGSEHPSSFATQHIAGLSRQSTQSFSFPGTIRLVRLPFLEGDFNRDRQVDAADIDALSEQIRSMGTDELYDVNGDGLVDMDDHTFWVEDLKGILHGDADMDGAVEFEDFLQLSASFEMEAGWAGGDFNGDGIAEFDDFLTLSGNFGQTVTAVASVPEPSSFVLLSLSLLALGTTRIRH